MAVFLPPTNYQKLKCGRVNAFFPPKKTVAQMAEAAEGHFTTEALMRKQDLTPTKSGRVREKNESNIIQPSVSPKKIILQSVDEFDHELKKTLLVSKTSPSSSSSSSSSSKEEEEEDIMPEGYLEAPLAYDAVWAVALGE